jgi:hypothetical protein
MIFGSPKTTKFKPVGFSMTIESSMIQFSVTSHHLKSFTDDVMMMQICEISHHPSSDPF